MEDLRRAPTSQFGRLFLQPRKAFGIESQHEHERRTCLSVRRTQRARSPAMVIDQGGDRNRIREPGVNIMTHIQSRQMFVLFLHTKDGRGRPSFLITA